MKVLLIGPVTRDVGGTYTTGICKVVWELSRQKADGIVYYVSSSNISDRNAKQLCEYPFQYNGYRWPVGRILCDVIFHPFRTFNEMKYYKNVLHENPLKWEFYKANMIRDIKNVKPDLIHVHQSLSALYFANTKHIPTIVTFHGVFYRGEPEQEYLKGHAWSMVDQSDFYTGLTTECERYMKNLFKIPSEKMTIIPNGTSTDIYYYSPEQRSRLRSQFDVSDDTIVFITVAGLNERKGQYRFITKVLSKLDIDYKYWILGDGEDRKKIEGYVSEHNLGDKIKCMGKINSEELYKYYSAADIYAHASKMEGQALCEMEAYATGIRTIVNKDIRDTVMTGVDDISKYTVIDFDDIDVDNLLKWIKLGNTNRQSRKDQTWNVIAEKYADFYRYVVAKTNMKEGR